MTANTNLERRVAEHYASEPQLRAPDRVLHAALATIDTTRQRRGLFASWRFTKMPTFAKLAAAVAVVAIVAFGVWQLVPGPSTGGRATPTPIPSPTQAPTGHPTQAPTTAEAPVLPPLTRTFTSERHGFSMSYPEGWTAQDASEPWTTLSFLNFGSPEGDLLHDAARDTGHLFIVAASQPLGDRSFTEWSAEMLAIIEADEPACTANEPVVVDGSDGMIGTECVYAIVAKGDRGYFFMFYLSDDEFDLRGLDLKAWAVEVLATVQLQPAQAVDAG